MYKAIISDIDGTLAPLTMHTEVSDTVKKAIRSLVAKNIVFCLATGKPFSMVEHLIDDLAISAPIITDNGAAIFHSTTRKVLWKSELDPAMYDGIIAMTHTYGKNIRCSDGYSGFDVVDKIPANRTLTKFMLRDFSFSEADLFVQKVKEMHHDLSVHKTSSHKGVDFMDIYITNGEATKNNAVKKVAQILGIKTDEIIGIGDHYNDISLLEACGLKVAMGNAVDELKNLADYIAPSVDNDGVADVIYKYFN